MRAVCVPGQVLPLFWCQTVCAGNRSPSLFLWTHRHRVTCGVQSAGALPLRSPHLRRLGMNDSATKAAVGGQMQFLHAAFFLCLLSKRRVKLSATLLLQIFELFSPSCSVFSPALCGREKRKDKKKAASAGPHFCDFNRKTKPLKTSIGAFDE